MDVTTEKFLFGTAGSSSGDSYWYARFGYDSSTPSNRKNDITVDYDGNVYVSYAYYQYDGGDIPYRYAIIKLDADGNGSFLKTYTTDDYDNDYGEPGITWIEFNRMNRNVFSVLSEPSFDVTGIQNLFRPTLYQLNSAGNELSAVKLFPPSSYKDTPVALTQDQSGNMYIASQLNYGGSATTVHKFNSSGAYQWSNKPLGTYGSSFNDSYPEQKAALVSTKYQMAVFMNYGSQQQFWQGIETGSGTFAGQQKYLNNLQFSDAANRTPGDKYCYTVSLRVSDSKIILTKYEDLMYGGLEVKWAKAFDSASFNTPSKPMSISVDEDDSVYLTYNSWIYKFSQNGGLVWKKRFVASIGNFVFSRTHVTSDALYATGAEYQFNFALKLPKDDIPTGDFFDGFNSGLTISNDTISGYEDVTFEMSQAQIGNRSYADGSPYPPTLDNSSTGNSTQYTGFPVYTNYFP